ncbi:hypothetical protein [Amycolatopsis sp. BJA-103]|uniref:hypothetical protein n=1 Tax=Amycolatopsis sp. BJA-103 TaxID=1911175 RepID=UPI000C78656D|nr:hypothetical protein [Amycolatopsis sp. BJA-103]AUI56792.1 hypothetical protein BKN51_00235 [Amycolatopsis sp. BJA-103]PNE13113.1 hypothetical protein B1H26_42375 [Amycolatopsis sp. BJA-103]
MPRTALTPQAVTRAGAELVLGAVDAAASPNGNSFPTNGREFVVIKNGDSASHTCTIPVNPASAPDGLPVTSRTVTVPAGKTFTAGPFPDAYRQNDGNVYLNWDSATQMTVAVLRIPS